MYDLKKYCMFSWQHVAARKGYEDIAQFLIEKDANVNAKGELLANVPFAIVIVLLWKIEERETHFSSNLASDYFGNTPLLEAVRNEHDEVASLLVNAGATLMLDHVGTFLCEAVASRELEFLKRLLFNGANPNAKLLSAACLITISMEYYINNETIIESIKHVRGSSWNGFFKASCMHQDDSEELI